MAIEIKVPDIGADEAEITKILAKVGDKVEVEQSLIAAEGGKASMKVPPPQTGIVKEIKVSVDDKIQTGTLIMIFNSANDVADAAPAQVEEGKEAAPVAAPTAAAARSISVPGIGNNGVEATGILVKVGDKIETEWLLIIVEGNKASMEVPASFVGTMEEVRVNVGSGVSTGPPIMIFEIAGEAGTAAPAARQEATPATAPVPTAGVKEVNASDIGGDEVEVTEVMVKVGDKVVVEQSLITVEGDKAPMGIPVPFAGIVKELKVNVGDEVKADSLIMILEIGGVAPAAAPAKQEAIASAPVTEAEAPATAPTTRVGDKSEFTESDAYIHATPPIHRLARKLGVNLAKVKDTGYKGRILREDVQAYVKEAIKRAGTVPTATGGSIPGALPRPKVDFSRFGEIEEVGLGRVQKTSGVDLNHNWVMIPHVTHFGKTDTIELEAFRKQQNEEAVKRKSDVKITPVVPIMKTITAALGQMPCSNSSLSGDGQHLIPKGYINIGVAVDAPNDSVVSVFKDVNKKGIIELSRELMTISKRTHDGKLTADEMQGDYFTISSTGGLGTIRFAPVVNASEVAILGVSKSVMEPVRNGKESVPRLMLLISLSFNHHVIDSADGACFVTIINNTLSDARRLMT